MKNIDEYKVTVNRKVWNRLHKEYHSRCSRCKWHRGENATHQPAHGKKKGHQRDREKIKDKVQSLG